MKKYKAYIYLQNLLEEIFHDVLKSFHNKLHLKNWILISLLFKKKLLESFTKRMKYIIPDETQCSNRVIFIRIKFYYWVCNAENYTHNSDITIEIEFIKCKNKSEC